MGRHCSGLKNSLAQNSPRKTGTCRVYTLISVGITDKDVFLQRQPAPPVSKLYTKLNYWLLDLD